MRLENAGFDRHSAAPRGLNEVFIQGTGSRGRCRGIETRAASLAAIAVQSELRNHQQRPADFKKTPVHFARFIGKHPQIDGFVDEGIGVGGGVRMRDAQQNEQPPANTARDGLIHFHVGCDTGARNALNDGSHDGGQPSVS